MAGKASRHRSRSRVVWSAMWGVGCMSSSWCRFVSTTMQERCPPCLEHMWRCSERAPALFVRTTAIQTSRLAQCEPNGLLEGQRRSLGAEVGESGWPECIGRDGDDALVLDEVGRIDAPAAVGESVL